MVIIVLSVLGAAIVSRSISESNLVKRFSSSRRGFWLAEAGIQRALWELNYGGSTWTGWVGSGETRTLQTSLIGAGDYEVTVANISSSNPQITSTGFFPNRNASDRAERTIIVRVIRDSIFDYAAFGQQSLTMSGNANTDSYDSAQGRYNQNGNRGLNGDVGTNGTTNGAITLTGNAAVRGDASTGLGGTVTTNGNAQVVPPGQITHQNNVDLPLVTVPPALANLSNGANFSLNGNQSQSLASGDYKFSSINISGNGQLTITGTARIYLTGSSSLSISGNGGLNIISGAQLTFYADGNTNISGNGIVNQSYLPQNFMLYATGTPGSRSIQISGNGDFHGAIYAPDASIDISGNGGVYGSIIGQRVNITGNGGVHYDEALGRTGNGLGKYIIQSWQDTQNPYPLIP